MTWEFWITAFIVTATPGTGALFTLAAGLTRGSRASLVAALGCTLGIVPHLIVAVSGAALVVATHPMALTLLKWGGVVYLVYMAWATLRSRGALAIEGEGRVPPTFWRTIGTAVAINLLNPKLTLFFLAFLPQFISPTASRATSQMVLLGLCFMALTLVVFAVYGLAAGAVRDAVVTRPRVMAWVRGALAASFVALGARLAVSV